MCMCVWREHNSFTADVKEVHTNDVVAICKILARPFLRLYKSGKYDWPSHTESSSSSSSSLSKPVVAFLYVS